VRVHCSRRSVGRHISSDGELLWPDVANQESIKAVQKLKPLQEMFDLTRQDHAQFYDLCKRLLTFEPNRRECSARALSRLPPKLSRELVREEARARPRA
jgi:hypothetical protein